MVGSNRQIVLRYSQIASLVRCPKTFEFQLCGIRPPRNSDLVLGSAVHYALAQYFQYQIDRGADMSLDMLLLVFADAWDKGVFGPEDQDRDIPIRWDDPKEYLLDLGMTLLRAYHKQIAPSIIPLAVEQYFAREVSGIILTSHPDLITARGIVDYKTTKRMKSQAEADKDLQPTIHLVVTNTPDAYYAFHCLLKHKVPDAKIVATTRTQASIKWFTDELLPPLVKMIEAGIFPPLGIQSFLCSEDYCGYYGVCRGSV